MSNRKKSKAVPVVLVITLLVAALAACGFLLRPIVTDPIRQTAAKEMAEQYAAVDKQNEENQQSYQQSLIDLRNQAMQPTEPEEWPKPTKTEGWEIIDVSTFPLEHATAEHKTRADVMNNGLLLVNAFHARPDDFNDADPNIVSIGRYVGGNSKIQVKDYNVNLFKVATDALLEAITAAKADGMEHYMVDEGYRSYSTQEALFNKKMDALSSKYKDENARKEAAMKEVNYPGTSEYNSGLSFRLQLYDRQDKEVTNTKYSTSSQGIWMNTHCWEYGFVFRFPQNAWPLETSTDKSFVTGISSQMNLYRYVGKGSATIMHAMDFCLEEYIQYLEEHPHVALFEDGQLKYEVYRQYVGEASSFDIMITRKARGYVSSLDNMGGVITVFEY